MLGWSYSDRSMTLHDHRSGTMIIEAGAWILANQMSADRQSACAGV
ncbi:hypothetical protein ACNTOD_001685 [Vibrio navarrensis]